MRQLVMSQDNDAQLLVRWRSGEQAAGNQLFVKYFPMLFRYFRSRAPADTAEDLIQSTCLALVDGKDRYIPESGQFRSYLLGIAHHMLMRHYRRYRRIDNLDLNFDGDLIGGDNSPEEEIAERQAEATLYTAISKLQPSDRQVLYLYYWGEHTAPDLALVFGVPEGTIRGRLRLAKSRLLTQISQSRPNPLPGREELQAMENEIFAELRRLEQGIEEDSSNVDD